MELRRLRYFVAVAQRRNFTAAAAALHVAQPALSQQIRVLERELGVVLFDRTQHRVRLSAVGEAFLARAERILAEVASAETEMAEFAGAVRGRLVIGTLASLAERQLPAVLAEFHARYAGIELVLREDSTAALLALVRAGAVDMALIHRIAGDTMPADIAVEPLFTEGLVAIVALDHHLAGRGGIAVRELRDEPFILTRSGSAIRQTVLDACAAAGFTPHIAFESGSTATVRALAAAGLGVGILPRSDALAPGPAVASVPLAEQLTRTVALARSAGRYRPVAADAFVTVAREALHRI